MRLSETSALFSKKQTNKQTKTILSPNSGRLQIMIQPLLQLKNACADLIGADEKTGRLIFMVRPELMERG